MKNVRVLDCTLRDGGRIIDCAFKDQEIKEISNRLTDANIDIIEVGFLRDWRNVKYCGNSTFFTDVKQIRPFVNKENKKTIYTAFIDFGMFDIDSLEQNDGTSIDAIRFGFTKKNYDEQFDEVIRWAKIIKEKGYKLFMQGVNSLNYTDLELLKVVSVINEIHPYSFGIVDTYGAMYMDDVDRIFGLIDNNMLQDICINFHSHNNYQLSFAFAQEVIKLSSKSHRAIIIDGTLGGMGKVAGNLNTELIVDFLVRKHFYDYEFENILDMLDDYIYKYKLKYKWGYSPEAMMAGIYKSHPNNVIYLTQKYRLDTKDIGKLLSMIDPETRQRYDYDNIQRIYTEYVADKIDDHDTIVKLKEIFEGKEVLVVVPGHSLNTYREKIDNYISEHQPIVVSVNIVLNNHESYAFFGNQRRYNRQKNKREGRKVIISSNIKSDGTENILVNYHSLINRGYTYFENSAIMLFNLLKRLKPKQVSIAGFDGFNKAIGDNYSDMSFQNERHVCEFSKLNEELNEMFNEIVETMSPDCKFVFLTPSLFE